MLNLPVDGFTLNPNTRYYPNLFYPGALSQMDLLRRANLYRPRWFVIPDDFNQPLPAYGTLEYQIKCGPASYVWGYRFIKTALPYYLETEPTEIFMQMTDSCTGVPFFSEFVGGAHAAFLQTVPTPVLVQIPYLLTQPRLILEPGLINVELSSTSSSDTYCQLLVLIAEPCTMVDDSGERRPL